jgi:hypothetical protein
MFFFKSLFLFQVDRDGLQGTAQPTERGGPVQYSQLKDQHNYTMDLSQPVNFGVSTVTQSRPTWTVP